LDEIIESEHKIAKLEELVVKKGQSSQTMNMIANQTNPIYHTKHKMALGNKTPCNLKLSGQFYIRGLNIAIDLFHILNFNAAIVQ
jgi:hypothetical protein